jgi:hypothetical protein
MKWERLSKEPYFVFVPFFMFILDYAFALCILLFCIFFILRITKVIGCPLLWIFSPFLLIGIIVFSLLWSITIVLPTKAKIIGIASIILIPPCLKILMFFIFGISSPLSEIVDIIWYGGTILYVLAITVFHFFLR